MFQKTKFKYKRHRKMWSGWHLSFGAKLITSTELPTWWGANICQYFISKFTKGADSWAKPDCI